jgi:hypothetical protein
MLQDSHHFRIVRLQWVHRLRLFFPTVEKVRFQNREAVFIKMKYYIRLGHLLSSTKKHTYS